MTHDKMLQRNNVDDKKIVSSTITMNNIPIDKSSSNIIKIKKYHQSSQVLSLSIIITTFLLSLQLTTSAFKVPMQRSKNNRIIFHPTLVKGKTPFSYSYENDRFCYSNTRLSLSSSTATMSTTSPTRATDDASPILLPMIEYTANIESFSSNDDGNNDEEYPPVIFLHGLLGSKRNFGSLATSLSSILQKRRRIYAMDLRNHGNDVVEDVRDSMSYKSMAQDVIETLDEMNTIHKKKNDNNKVILVGHSMGGKVAASIALLYPERIQGLIVLDMAPVTYTIEQDVTWKAIHDIITGLHTQIDLSICQTKRDVDLQLRNNLLMGDPALRAFILTNISINKNNGAVQWTVPMDILTKELSTLGGWEFSSTEQQQQQKQYMGDTFFIAGGQSKFVRSSHLPSIKEQFPNHMLTTIRGAGHWLHAEAPDDVLALLKKYLDR